MTSPPIDRTTQHAEHQARALDRSVTLPRPRPKAPWIAVSGGKGGVGKTLLATNLAILLAKSGRRVLLVDLDPGLGDVHVHLRVTPGRCLEDAVEAHCQPTDLVTRVRHGLDLVTGRSGSTLLAGGDRKLIERALDAVAAAVESHDVVVCDTGAGIGPAVIETTRRAHRTLAVTTADPAAATDAYALIKVLGLQGIDAPRLVVNRVRSREQAMSAATRLGSVCERFLGHGLQLAGWLREAPALEQSIRQQRAFAEAGGGAVLEDLAALTAGLADLLPPTTPEERPSDREERRTALQRLARSTR